MSGNETNRANGIDPRSRFFENTINIREVWSVMAEDSWVSPRRFPYMHGSRDQCHDSKGCFVKAK